MKLAEREGITLLVIPYWWDGTEDRYMFSPFSSLPPLPFSPFLVSNIPFLNSLLATIINSRPDLLPDKKSVDKRRAIPLIIPDSFDSQKRKIVDIGEPTKPLRYRHSRVDPTNWLTSPFPIEYLQEYVGTYSNRMVASESFGIL